MDAFLQKRAAAAPTPLDYKVPQSTFMAIAWAGVAISLLFIVFRLAVRVRSFSKLFLDDILVVLAWFMFLASTIVWQVKVHVLYWEYDVNNGRAPPTPAFLNAFQHFIVHVVTWNVLFYSALWTVKASFLVFFRRLDSNVVGWRRWGWYVVYVVCVLTYIACIADIDYGCSVADVNKLLAVCPGASHVNFQFRTFYANMAADILTDILILSIPFSLLWKVRIPLKKKLILLSIFSLTVVVIVVAIIRVVLISDRQSNGPKYAHIDWLYLWSNVEISISLIVACLASFRQLFTSTKATSSQPWSVGKPPTTNKGSILSFLLRTRRSRDAEATGGDSSVKSVSSHSSRSQTELRSIPLNAVHVRHTIDIGSHHSDAPAQATRNDSSGW